MKHFNRLCIIMVWFIIAGVSTSVFLNLNNFLKLGWPSLLFYVFFAISVIYAAVQYSKTWSKM